jgi:hypothetical protein
VPRDPNLELSARFPSALIFNSIACDWTPLRWSEEKAKSAWSTAAAEGVLLARAMRIRILPRLIGSWPKMGRDWDASYRTFAVWTCQRPGAVARNKGRVGRYTSKRKLKLTVVEQVSVQHFQPGRVPRHRYMQEGPFVRWDGTCQTIVSFNIPIRHVDKACFGNFNIASTARTRRPGRHRWLLNQDNRAPLIALAGPGKPHLRLY